LGWCPRAPYLGEWGPTQDPWLHIEVQEVVEEFHVGPLNPDRTGCGSQERRQRKKYHNNVYESSIIEKELHVDLSKAKFPIIVLLMLKELSKTKSEIKSKLRGIQQ